MSNLLLKLFREPSNRISLFCHLVSLVYSVKTQIKIARRPDARKNQIDQIDQKKIAFWRKMCYKILENREEAILE
jgi:predicted phosphoadenosine phosphosulfate sulfurtransferase